MVNLFGRLILLMCLFAPAFAQAQAVTTSPDATPAPEKLERVEVTGSHIKRVDTEGVSPVETVTKKDIEKKGYDNLGDVVRDLGANSFGSSTVSGNSSTPGNADINLRGLGSDNTLVLLNGQRLPQDAITGTVDINLIPMAAVERIEILQDGASAIYGSDALGGVVNIITVKDFQGTQLSATQSMSTNEGGGRQTNLSLVNGINSEKFNAVTTINYRYNQAVQSSDRDFMGQAVSHTGSPGSYFDNAGEHYSSNCPLSQQAGVAGSQYCTFKYTNYSEEAPLISQVGAMTEMHYELSSDVRLYSRFNYTRRYSETVAAPAPTSTGFSVPTTSTGYGVLTGAGGGASAAGGGDLLVVARTLALGPRINEYETNSYGGLVGATIQLPKDWQGDVVGNVNYITNSNNGVSGFSRVCSQGSPDANGVCTGGGNTGIADLVNSGAYNPLAANGAQGSVAATNYNTFENSNTLLTSLEVKASGDLFEMPAGPLGLAVGASVAFSDYHDVSDPETVGTNGNTNVVGGGGSNGAGHRIQEAAYGEFSVPVVKAVELQLASRYDHFSDFGSTFNPKAGILIHATKDLLFRGSVGTGFRAPLLTELYAGTSAQSPGFIDRTGCAANPGNPSYCQSNQYTVFLHSNPNLKQETAISYNAGTVYAPTSNFNVGLDFFYSKISNTPGLDYDDMSREEALIGDAAMAAQYGVNIHRVDGQIQSIDVTLQNLSETTTSGVDLTAGYVLNKWKFGTDQNQMFYYRTSGFPGIPVTNKLDWYGMPRWRNTTSAGYSFSDTQNLTMYVRTIPGQQTYDFSGRTRSLTTVDLSYVIKTASWGEFSFTVVNVLNTAPPTDASQPETPVNYSLYDLNGRQIVVGYKKMI